jgi:Ca2+-binding RTX toxin-like protein
MADFLGTLNAELVGGTAGADTYDMLGGNDTIQGSAGADSILGGDDVDLVDYSASTSAVSVDLSSGLGTGGDADGDTYVGIENVTGSAQNDTLIGDGLDNVLDGGNGDDLFVGGDGNDAFYGGEGTDTVDYTDLGASVLIDLNYGFGGEGDEDSYASIENAIGSGFDDFLFGNGGANHLQGGAGNDTLAGEGTGEQTGGDTLDGGLGNDRALYTLSGSGITINLSTGAASGGQAEGDVLTSIEEIEGSNYADHLTGDTGNNQFAGNSGNDTLIGGAGNDTIVGGFGDDLIDGGTGNVQRGGHGHAGLQRLDQRRQRQPGPGRGLGRHG